MTEPAQARSLPTTRAFTPMASPLTVQVKVAVAERGQGQPTTDIQVLLRKRLRFLSFFVCIGTFTIVLFVFIPSFMLTPHAWPGFWYLVISVYSLLATTMGVVGGVLWSRLALSLRQLRGIELFVFGMGFIFFIWIQCYIFPFIRLPDPPDWFGGVKAAAISLPWIYVIIMYGIFIPNTWRRCTAVVGVLAVTPVVIAIVAEVSAGSLKSRMLADLITQLTIYMALAAVFAIYGCHRIDVLRQEVAQARKLGQYQLKQRLGSGGMGEVYLAEHLLLRRPCAVKLIRADRAADPSALIRFEREVQTTATLTHPNTVQIFDYGHAEDGTFYYAMEYLPGLSLQELVARHGPLLPGRAVYLLRQVCGALREAHAIGLIHRDIKPNNILVCERGGNHDVAKLLDFGLVQAPEAGKSDGKLTQEGAVLGTPTYMSPEQAGGTGNLDARSDIYSLGAVAYFLLTGELPFKGSSAVQILAAHLYEPVKPPRSLCPEIPADLEEVVMRCMEKNPAARYGDVQSLDQALAKCQCSGDWNSQKAASWWQSVAEPNRGGAT